MNSLDLLFRDKIEEDESFIYSSQIKNLYDSYPHSNCKWGLFNDNQSLLIKKLFTISNTIIACLPDEPDIIIGYLMYNNLDHNLIVHYEYVKQAYRGNGVGNDLLTKASAFYREHLIVYSQINNMYPILKKKHQNITYDPFIIQLLCDKESL